MRRKATIAWLTVVVVVAGLIVGGGAWLLSSVRNAFVPSLAVGCTATVGENSYWLAVDQNENAALISGLAIQRGMPARAASIALATALQESKLRNIDYGDLDSVGLFQQRPSQDWGSVAQIMDPVYSANAFYDVLAQVPDYVNLPINDAAQIVQRSGYPHAYAQHEPLSRAFASALTGQTPQGLNCTLPSADAGSSAVEVIAAAQVALGQLPMQAGSPQPDGGNTVEITTGDTLGWMTAHWALANAQSLGIVQIDYAGLRWDREATKDGENLGWQPTDSARTGNGTGMLMLTLAPPAVT